MIPMLTEQEGIACLERYWGADKIGLHYAMWCNDLAPPDWIQIRAYLSRLYPNLARSVHR